MNYIFRIVAALIVGMTVLVSTNTTVHAEESHENPDTAKTSFSTISLLNYYSISLDYTLSKNPEEVDSRMTKMPFANVPDTITQLVDDYAPLVIDISYEIQDIDGQVRQLETLVGQSRINEALTLSRTIFPVISKARTQVYSGIHNVEDTGTELGIENAPETGLLREQYDAVIDKMNQILDMLSLYENYIYQLLASLKNSEQFPENIDQFIKSPQVQLENILNSANLTVNELAQELGVTVEELAQELGVTVEELTQGSVPEEIATIPLEKLLQQLDITLPQLLEKLGITQEQLLQTLDINYEQLLQSLSTELQQSLLPVRVTLETEKTEYFVGDTVSFNGTLTTESGPLAGRRIDILAGGDQLASVLTDRRGNYSGTFQMPYTYVDQIEVRALYTPVDQDKGIYMAGTSPAVVLDVLFYPTDLQISLDNEAYPGYDTTISGTLTYGDNPVPDKVRKVEIYIDDVLQSQIVADDSFSESVFLDPQITVGTHIVLVSVEAEGRYAPALETAMLKVTRITPEIQIDSPKIALIPGNLSLTGRIYSPLGPVTNAKISIRFGSDTKEITSSEDGSFTTRVGSGLSFGLVGSQDLTVLVEPEEPYYTTFQATRSILLINIISSIVFLILLLLAGIYLPGRIRKRIAAYRRERAAVFVPLYEPEVPIETVKSDRASAEEQPEEIQREPRERILNWYVLIIRTLQKLTRIFLTPQHTLREFAAEVSGYLGPLSRYFWDFTKTVERLLYSRYTPTTVDVSSSEQYFHELEGNTEGEPITLGPAEVGGEESPVAVSVEDDSLKEEYVPASRESVNGLSIGLLIVLALLILFYIAGILLLVPLIGAVSALCLPMIPAEYPEISEDNSVTPEDTAK